MSKLIYRYADEHKGKEEAQRYNLLLVAGLKAYHKRVYKHLVEMNLSGSK